MSESSPSSSIPCRRPFQFGLAAAFTVVTGLCIILSLVVWDANVGSALAILTVGSFWTLAAVRSGYRRLAYHLVCLPLGVLAYGLLSLPISPATREVLSSWGISAYSQKTWPHWLPVVMMCVATFVAAWALRRWIRRLGRVGLGALGLAAVVLTAAVFGWCCLLSPFSPVPLDSVLSPEGFVWVCILIPLFGLIIGAMSLHVAWPAAILFCVLLRSIDPEVRQSVGAQATAKDSDGHGAKAPEASSGSDPGQ